MKISFARLAVILTIVQWLNIFIQSPANSVTKLEEDNYRIAQRETTTDVQPPTFDKSDRLNFIERASAKDDSPQRRQPGGKFGDKQCPSVSLPLTALVPGIGAKSFRSLTAQEHPTFWFYVPYSSESKLSAEFVLIDNNNRLFYRDTYPLTATPGIVSISLPSKLPPLEIGKDYLWVLSVRCSLSEDRSGDISVKGKVQRVQPSPNFLPRATATSEEKAILYAKDGLWNDTLTTVIKELHPIDSQKANLLMTELLHSADLNSISKQRIVECCTPSK